MRRNARAGVLAVISTALAVGQAPAAGLELPASVSREPSGGTASASSSERGPNEKPAPAASVQPHGVQGIEERPNVRSTETHGCPGERVVALDPAAEDQPLQLGLKTYRQTLALADKEVVLTFDDGPVARTTPEVLAALKAACVHATFFLIGRNAAQHPDLARQEVIEGHTVGHHSNSHPAFTLRGFDTRSAERDIEAGIAADDAAAYPGAAPPDRPHVPFFRFPGFADTHELDAFLAEKHIAVFGTDLWAADWVLMTQRYERLRVLGLLGKSQHHNGIILFHDTKVSTAKMLPALLRDLKQRGYTFVHLVYAPGAAAAKLTKPVEGWTSETERIIGRLRHPIAPGTHHLDASAEARPSGARQPAIKPLAVRPTTVPRRDRSSLPRVDRHAGPDVGRCAGARLRSCQLPHRA